MGGCRHHKLSDLTEPSTWADSVSCRSSRSPARDADPHPYLDASSTQQIPSCARFGTLRRCRIDRDAQLRGLSARALLANGSAKRCARWSISTSPLRHEANRRREGRPDQLPRSSVATGSSSLFHRGRRTWPAEELRFPPIVRDTKPFPVSASMRARRATLNPAGHHQ